MNHKQKLGYTLLGAGIMAVGITIGQFVTPTIKAQSNEVFDTIVCRELFVKNTGLDGSGVIISPDSVIIARGDKKAIELYASEQHGNTVKIYNPKTGKRAVEMGGAGDIDVVSLWDRRDANSLSVAMFGSDNKSGVFVTNPQTGKKAAEMKSDEFANYLNVYDYKKSSTEAFHFLSSSFDDFGNVAMYYNRKIGEIARLKD